MNKEQTLLNDTFLFSAFFYFIYCGIMYLYCFNYWHDYLEIKTLTIEQRLFLMNYNNFHYEHGIWLIFFALASIFLILMLEPRIFTENFYVKKWLKEKIKEGINEYNKYSLRILK